MKALAIILTLLLSANCYSSIPSWAKYRLKDFPPADTTYHGHSILVTPSEKYRSGGIDTQNFIGRMSATYIREVFWVPIFAQMNLDPKAVGFSIEKISIIQMDDGRYKITAHLKDPAVALRILLNSVAYFNTSVDLTIADRHLERTPEIVDMLKENERKANKLFEGLSEEERKGVNDQIGRTRDFYTETIKEATHMKFMDRPLLIEEVHYDLAEQDGRDNGGKSRIIRRGSRTFRRHGAVSHL